MGLGNDLLITLHPSLRKEGLESRRDPYIGGTSRRHYERLCIQAQGKGEKKNLQSRECWSMEYCCLELFSGWGREGVA